MHQTDPTHRPMMAGLAALAILALALAACGGGASPSGAASAPAASQAASEEPMVSEEPAASEPAGNGETITITNATSFGGVDELSVAVGTTVTFVNDSSFPHTVTNGTDGQALADAAFDEQLPADATVTITFDEAGEFPITCVFHSVMNMVVTVE